MTRYSHYDVHQTYDVYTLSNKSAMYWPILSASIPLVLSSITRLFSNLVNQSYNTAPVIVVDGFEIVHKGNADIRVGVDAIEGLANESTGKILSPGEGWNPPFRVKSYISFYTSSNVSQQLQVSLGGYM